jgi:DNA-3-methyladenine glycosylase I
MHTVARCDWAGSDPLYCAYHDNEWGQAGRGSVTPTQW